MGPKVCISISMAHKAAKAPPKECPVTTTSPSSLESSFLSVV